MPDNYIHPRLDPNNRFRERRRQSNVKRRRRRFAAVTILLALGAGLGAGATVIGGKKHEAVSSTPAIREAPARVEQPAGRVAWPREVRGVHVTMALAGLEGKIDEYVALKAYGLNALEVDVKDENGKIGFVSAALPKLGREIGAAQPYYDVGKVVRTVHAAGMYLIGRVVVMEDPTLSTARPDLALLRPDGSHWLNNGGLGWVNPYDERVWRYVVGVGKAAARAGFDEIQFDYVRFPSDGDVSQIVFRHQVREPKGTTIARFLRYAGTQLHPLGVRVSADVFGLAATHDLGIGQVPRRVAKYVDALYPMVYPSHFSSGEYGIPDPDAYPGRTVARALFDFRRQVKGTKTALIPWLQDFSLAHQYGLIEVTDQIAAARRQHARGFLLWNPEGVYTQEALTD
ncbi:MAG TPA: putative glycoside hydrolase [Gaiellaceae bacterium]|nr:putative glycoside hydrolase [Gaiellaceae bacterium]